MPDKDLLKTLRALVKGLTFPSESDKPVKAISWKDSGKDGGKTVDEAALRAAAVVPAAAKIEVLSVADFLDPVIKAEAWWGDEEKARGEKFRALQAELEKLTGTTAFRVTGANADISRVDAYVVGRTGNGGLAGIQTQLIET